MVMNEIKATLEEIDEWTKPRKVKRSLASMLDNAYTVRDPLGVVLIIGPWNYPFQLMFCPLIGAIAAGNCIVMKPSELSVQTTDLMLELVPKYLDPELVQVFPGAIPETTALLKERFDHILYTGATPVGRIIMRAAAEHLTPVTLELGGKSPTIIDTQTDLATAAKRLTWGKWVNCGQTCIAPDYVLCLGGATQQTKLIEAIRDCLEDFYGTLPSDSKDYGRVINERHFDRLSKLLDGTNGHRAIGGKVTDKKDLYIEPTVLTDVKEDDIIMQDEIFGPILPVLQVSSLDDAIAFINKREKPLALYLFSDDKAKVQKICQTTSSGALTVNDALMHAGLDTLPFGGVGHSGMGRYHGKYSFDTFTHEKAVLHRGMGGENMMWIRYPPYDEKKAYWADVLTTKRSIPFL